MELRHLRYFVAVAEDLSFRRAAERLHLSHPALTKQIGDLENELGLKLFHRNHRRVELTEVGHGFLADARRTLISAQQAIAHAHEAAKGERGHLSIGTISPVTYAFLNEALSQFRELFPLVEVTVLHMDGRTQIDALLNGSIMLGIAFRGLSFEEVRGEDLTMKLLLRSAYCLVCSRPRWPAKGRTPKLSEFRNDNFLSFSPGTADDHEHLVRTICQLDGGFEPKLLQVANSADSAISMATAGRGVFLAPEISLCWRPTINYSVLPDSKNRFELYVIRRKNSEGEATVNNFVRILFDVVGRLLGKDSLARC